MGKKNQPSAAMPTIPTAEDILAAAEDEDEAPKPEVEPLVEASDEMRTDSPEVPPPDEAPKPEVEPAPIDRRLFVCENTMTGWRPPGHHMPVHVEAGTKVNWTQDEVESALAAGAKLRPVYE